MMKRILILVVLLSVVSVYSYEQQVFNKVNLNPFYLNSMTKGSTYTFTVRVEPPSNSRVVSAMLHFQIYISPSVNFTVTVNNTPCLTPYFYISTTYSGAGQSLVRFECSNVINRSGVYVVKLTPNLQNTGALNGWLEYTYVMTPPSLSVFGTEYDVKDFAKVWVQVLDADKSYVDNATCLLSIYYPDNTILYKDLFMDYLDRGIYYYDFDIPDVVGVYPVAVECFYVTNTEIYNATSGGINIGTLESGSYISTQINDGVYWKVKESGGRVDIGLNFSGLVEPLGLSDIVFGWNGIWKMEKDDAVGDYLTFYVWNYTSLSWVELDNNVYYSDVEQTITNTLSISDLNASGLVSSGNMMIRINDTGVADTKVSKIQTDYFYVGLIGFYTGEYQEVKGAGELHVGNMTKISENVWEYENRTLTYYPYPEYPEFNYSQMSDVVWNYPNRTLTYYPEINYTYFDEVLGAVNVSLSDLIVTHNDSVFGMLNLIKNDLNNMNDTLIGINNTLSNLKFNTTDLENMIVSVNDTVKLLYDGYLNVSNVLENISLVVYGINETMNDRFDYVYSELDSVKLLINAHNSTVMNKLYSIQAELSSIVNDISYMNTTIRSDLDEIIYKLSHLNVTCENVSATLPPNWCSDVGFCTVEAMLHESSILKKKLSNHNYCLDNKTLIHNITYRHCGYFGCIDHSELQPEECQWGCNIDNAICNPSPLPRIAVLSGIIIFLFIMTRLMGLW